VAGRRKNYSVRKGHSHLSDQRPSAASSNRGRTKRSSMPCVGTGVSCYSDDASDSSDSQQVASSSVVSHRHDSRGPNQARPTDHRSYSAVIDETEEWAQVILWHQYSLFIHLFIYSFIHPSIHSNLGG